jgi:hypothetical protein
MPEYCTSPNPLLKERAAIENFEFGSNNLFKNQIYKINGIQLPLLQERAGGEALPSLKSELLLFYYQRCCLPAA